MESWAVSPSVLEKYARELQQSWLSGKIFPTWGQPAIEENFPSLQVHRFLYFQVEVQLLEQMQALGHWSLQEGGLLEAFASFVTQARAHLAIPHVKIAPFLHQAIYQSLYLLARPKEALTRFFFQNRKALSLAELRFYGGYLAYFDFVPIALASYMERQRLAVLDETMWREKLDRVFQIYEEEAQEKMETYQRRHLEGMVKQPFSAIQARWEALKQAEEDVIGSIITGGGEEEIVRNLFGTSPGAGSEGGASDVQKARKNPLLSAIDYEPRQVLAERFAERPRRADTLKRFDMDAIPIHKQFVFVQRIFDGDIEAFREAIEALNQVHTAEEATAHLSRWISDKTDPQVAEEFRRWVLSRLQS